jgi:hypothetical protein
MLKPICTSTETLGRPMSHQLLYCAVEGKSAADIIATITAYDLSCSISSDGTWVLVKTDALSREIASTIDDLKVNESIHILQAVSRPLPFSVSEAALRSELQSCGIRSETLLLVEATRFWTPTAVDAIRIQQALASLEMRTQTAIADSLSPATSRVVKKRSADCEHVVI